MDQEMKERMKAHTIQLILKKVEKSKNTYENMYPLILLYKQIKGSANVIKISREEDGDYVSIEIKDGEYISLLDVKIIPKEMYFTVEILKAEKKTDHWGDDLFYIKRYIQDRQNFLYQGITNALKVQDMYNPEIEIPNTTTLYKTLLQCMPVMGKYWNIEGWEKQIRMDSELVRELEIQEDKKIKQNIKKIVLLTQVFWKETLYHVGAEHSHYKDEYFFDKAEQYPIPRWEGIYGDKVRYGVWHSGLTWFIHEDTAYIVPSDHIISIYKGGC